MHTIKTSIAVCRQLILITRTDTNSQQEVFRGGSWLNLEWYYRAASRYYGHPSYCGFYVGFRCAWPQDSKK